MKLATLLIVLIAAGAVAKTPPPTFTVCVRLHSRHERPVGHCDVGAYQTPPG